MAKKEESIATFGLVNCIVAGVGFLADAYDLFVINIGKRAHLPLRCNLNIEGII
jgi:hypothetical protein